MKMALAWSRSPRAALFTDDTSSSAAPSTCARDSSTSSRGSTQVSATIGLAPSDGPDRRTDAMASKGKTVGAALLIAGVAVLGAQASPALGQEADAHATAVRLFEEAGQAQDRGAYDEACPKF